jgi:glycosyl hydrolase family 106( putative alpha-L-rhamnosidase)
LIFFTTTHAQLQWPTITKTSKPWTRWWWEGSAVTKQDLSWNLEQYHNAGLGGVEITPIYGVHGYEKQFIQFLSPQWMQMLVHTLNESKRVGLGVDLANATGWPFGGPWVTDSDASKSIYFKIYHVNGGEQLKDPIEFNQEAMVRTANNRPAGIDSILRPVSANKNLQSLALDQIQYPGKLPLRTLIAYSDKKEMIDLSARVDAGGKLNWTAPSAGTDWTLYALFEGLHGKMVERAAPGGEGYAIDHFSSRAAQHYFKKFDDAFKGFDLSYLRGFFNDSYEVDDARGQANWTPDFFEQFKKRKGYDLKAYLPALFGKDDSDKIRRVTYDYRSVIDELILDNFTREWKKWGASKGKILRNQSHGSPANTLDLYSVVDIPETEGTDILRFKFATSAANVMGKKLVSSESATWLNEHFLSSWGDVKKAIDLYFLGGVNHIFYHGSAYSPKDAPWPGWLFYAAVHFQPTNPQWKDFHVLNEYIARVQSFLQNSKPDNDVLLYYPIADRYSEPGNALLQHFDGMERNFEKTDFEYVSKWMIENGYSFDFFSDRQLQHFTVSGHTIISGGNHYKTILLPNNRLLPLESMQKLLDLARQGAHILFYKEIPSGVPGFGNLEKRQTSFKEMTGSLHWFRPPNIVKVDSVTEQAHKEDNYGSATIGSGSFSSANSLASLLSNAQIVSEPMVKQGLQFVRKKDDNGTIYFITNRTENPFHDWVRVQKSQWYGLFDPMTGESGKAAFRFDNEGGAFVLLDLLPYQSVILQSYVKQETRIPFHYPDRSNIPVPLSGKWTLDFLNGGPTIPASRSLEKLVPWTELDGDDVKDFSGVARYSISFSLPTVQSPWWSLDLGKVNETAEVILNGKSIATLIGPRFKCRIPLSAFGPTNKLEIVVANLMANRIAYMDRNNIPWKIFYNTNMPARRRENLKNGLFDASAWKPLTSGLSGPVTLTPVK